MHKKQWHHLAVIVLLWSGVAFVTRGDSCDGEPPPANVVATADPTVPLDQLKGVIIIVTLVDKAGQPVPAVKATMTWNSDSDKMAGTTSTGTSNADGQILFSNFADADYGTWTFTVEGNYTHSLNRFRMANNPNYYRHVVDVVPTPSPTPTPEPTPTPTPSETPTPSPSATPTPEPTPVATATVTYYYGGGGSSVVTATPTPVAGSGPVNTQVNITPGSPVPGNVDAVIP